ncbi:MAG: hypothetical protein ACOX7J_07785 [Bacillota bacterium]|jgi:hypothetical protein
MKDRLFFIFCITMIMFGSCGTAYGLNTESMAQGTGTFIKIGIVLLLTFLLLLTAVFAYGLTRNWLKTRKKND